jgi:hypothetical protein
LLWAHLWRSCYVLRGCGGSGGEAAAVVAQARRLFLPPRKKLCNHIQPRGCTMMPLACLLVKKVLQKCSLPQLQADKIHITASKNPQSNSAVSAASSLQLDSLLKARLRALKRLDHSDSCSLHTGEPVCARHVCLGCDTSGKHKFSLLSTAFGDLALLAGISHCMHSHCAAWERADSSRS